MGSNKPTQLFITVIILDVKVRSSIYEIFITSSHSFVTGSLEPAPNVSGFIAQLVRASHRYREGRGSNPLEVLTFSGFCTQLLKLLS